MDIKILFVDDEDIVEDLVEFFNNEQIEGHTLKASGEMSFESGLERLRAEKFDIIVLDLCKGKASDAAEQEGLALLEDIQKRTFIPVVFHTAVAYKIEDLKSLVVGVSDKKNGTTELASEIKRIILTNIVFLKDRVNSHVENEFKKYFWDTIHSKREIFTPEIRDFSLGYLILRRLANSLSKDNIKQLTGDSRIINKALPMEFYIYPSENLEFQAGEILLKDDVYYTILTPSCDFIEDRQISRTRTVGKVLLAVTTPLSKTDAYAEYKKNPNEKNTIKISRLIETRKGDRYFFLPGTPFMENLVLDFQDKTMVDYSGLSSFTRVAKLDSPFAQSMIASFIRYYNRIGFPDIDAQHVLSSL